MEGELDRVHSASSLRLLLTDPLGFVWKYAFRWDEPADVEGEEPVLLDPLAVGDLVHNVLEKAVAILECMGGFAGAPREALEAAISSAVDEVRLKWESSVPVPPKVIWEKTLRKAGELALLALTFDLLPLPGQRSYVEVPFGSAVSYQTPLVTPWDPAAPVLVRELGIRVSGRIDRLDLSGDAQTARVIDYKAVGKCPPEDPGLKNGNELQRCLYSVAVRALLPGIQHVDASLLYPTEQRLFTLDQPDQFIGQLVSYLRLAYENIRDGKAPPGIGAESKYNKLKFAFPSNADGIYFPSKRAARDSTVGSLLTLWEAS